jgi:hypothetical protein
MSFLCPECGNLNAGQPESKVIEDTVFFIPVCSSASCRIKTWSVCVSCSKYSNGEGYKDSRESFLKRHVASSSHRNWLVNNLSNVERDHKSSTTSMAGIDLLEKSQKRTEDHDRSLKKTLRQNFGSTMQMDMLWFALGMQQDGTVPLVMNACFPTDYNKDKDTADKEELRAEFLSSHNYFLMTKSMREQVVNQCNFYYNLGRKHQKEDEANNEQVAATKEYSKLSPPSGTYLPIARDPESKNHPVNKTVDAKLRARRIVPPRNINEVNTRYLISNHSITKNLPIPPVGNSFQEHATTNLVDCLKDFFSNGTPFGLVTPEPPAAGTHESVSWITESLHASTIRAFATDIYRNANTPPTLTRAIAPYIIWRDDFESNNSTKKKGSTWCMTVTFAPNQRRHNLLQQTYPLAIGSSKEDHDNVEEFLLEKIHFLMNKPVEMFSYLHGGSASVMALPYAFICDQPERRKATRTMNGNALYHARYRHSINHKALLHVLRTCDKCVEELRSGNLPKNCRTCVAWDPFPASESQKDVNIAMLKLPLPEHYPTTDFGEKEAMREQYISKDLGDGEWRILPFQLTSCRLKQSFHLAYKNLVSGDWSGKNVRSFLDRECFVGDLTQRIISHAGNARALAAILSESSNETVESQDCMLRDHEKNPEKYIPPKIPFSWRIYKDRDCLFLFPDVLMHLMFLGIVKTTLTTIKTWMTQQRMFTDFKNKIGKFDKMLSNLKLDWLPVQEYRSGGFGGWVSEHYLAFSRIMMWFFQDLADLDSAEDDSEPPTAKPTGAWKKHHYLAWLSRRGIKFDSKHTIAKLKVQISGLMNQEGGPPPVRTTAAAYSSSQVERVIVSLHEMIAIVMAEEIQDTTAQTMELQIKLFLTEFDLLDQQIKTEGSTPSVISSFNFVSLLNLPKSTLTFGPLRNLWEGSFKGEGYIQHCKQFIHGVQKKGYAKNSVTHCLLQTAYMRAAQKLQDVSPHCNPSNWSEFMKAKRGGYKTYSSRQSFFSVLSGETQDIISVVVCLRKMDLTLSMVDKGAIDPIVFGCYNVSTNLVQKGDTWSNQRLHVLERDSCIPILKKMGGTYNAWRFALGIPNSWGNMSIKFPFDQHHVSLGALLPLNTEGGIRYTLIVHSRFGHSP